MDALILRKVIFDLLVFLGDNNSSIFIGLALSRHATALAKPSNELEESRQSPGAFLLFSLPRNLVMNVRRSWFGIKKLIVG